MANVTALETRIDPWVLVGEVDQRTPRYDPHFLPSEEPVFLARFLDLDLWATKHHFQEIVTEGTGVGWPRFQHRNASPEHLASMWRTLQTLQDLRQGGAPRRSLQDAQALFEEIQAAIDGWLEHPAERAEAP
jgi:hypothetical protein